MGDRQGERCGVVPFTVRIRARGELGQADRLELPGFDASAEMDELVLLGTVPDEAALLGVLTRLIRAGVSVRDLERIPTACVTGPGGPSGRARPQGAFLARIQLAGRIAGHLRQMPDAEVMSEVSASTTIEVELDEEHALEELLMTLNSRALHVLELRVRPVHGMGGSATLS
ncbi:MAG TPA: hypothetical protein VK045_08710 [Ornithinicoccus sp.]|nr:hypothetical protein [Ornithinicoccus sp.]